MFSSVDEFLKEEKPLILLWDGLQHCTRAGFIWVMKNLKNLKKQVTFVKSHESGHEKGRNSTVSAVFWFVHNKLYFFLLSLLLVFFYIYCFAYLFFCLVTVIISYIGNKRLCSENLNFKVMRCFRISIIVLVIVCMWS